MPSELDLQKMVCDAVNDAGGFARKLSHRHLVGVSDLLVKLPDYKAALFEVKKNSYPVKLQMIKLDVTVLQGRFLKAASDAGMVSGLISFLLGPSRNEIRMWVGVTETPLVKDHVPLARSDRARDIIYLLAEFCRLDTY